MPRTITVDKLPCGFAQHLSLEGERVTVVARGAISSDEGWRFSKLAEGLISTYPELFDPDNGIPPYKTSTFLAVLHPNNSVDIYHNELGVETKAKTKHTAPSYQENDLVFLNDITEVSELSLLTADDSPVIIPEDCGYELILSYGWRRVFAFDYTPLPPFQRVTPTRSLQRLFAGYMNWLLIPQVFQANDEQIRVLRNWGWFLFSWMSTNDYDLLLNLSGCTTKPQAEFDKFCERFQSSMNRRLESWLKHEELAIHRSFIEQAFNRYAEKDYLSSLSLLLPRIEGVLRRLLKCESDSAKHDSSNYTEGNSTCEPRPEAKSGDVPFREVTANHFSFSHK